ncbi:DnaJ domain-containing protein [Ramlibacter rhizophilus]|uniref:DnaJ domain-containing protein n=1 Tax=Ramlibacter rhizophilus TaxID=1781167 RepID=UPI0014325F0A|nr:DnaJ domain-containing protein [Ramlibacter rhizophilus]
MTVDDCYSELGLQPQCSDEELKSAWRRLVARWHPDRNDSPQAVLKMQRINRAIEEIRRARAEPVAREPEPAAETAPDEPAVERIVRVTLEEALAGCVKTVQGELVADCTDCAGSGRQACTCTACGGTGGIRQSLWFGWVTPAVACQACEGTGNVGEPCAACAGAGRRTRGRWRCRITIPAGTREGELPAQAARAKGDTGEFSLRVRPRVVLQEHELFRIEPDGSLRCDMPVDGFAWMAERWIEVPTPSGLQQMRLRRGALTYRLRAQGFPGPHGLATDCLVTVQPIFPDELSATQDACIDRLVQGNAAARKGSAAWREQVARWAQRVNRT